MHLESASAIIDAKAQSTDLSFGRALHLIRHELLFAAAIRAYGDIPAKLNRLCQQLMEALKKSGGGNIAPAASDQIPLVRIFATDSKTPD